MGYAILRVDKLKSKGDMNAAFKHNMRLVDVCNADKDLVDLNREPVDRLNGLSYWEAFEAVREEKRADGTWERDIRSDAVRGLEVMLTYSGDHDEELDVDAWIDTSTEWLEAYFNKGGPRDSSNVVSVVVHLDEQVPHIHAFVIPLDERGHLNSTAYIGGKKALAAMQSSYAKAVQQYGLKRGERFSVATREERKEFYSRLTRAVHKELPLPEKGEGAEAYYNRANDVYKTASVHHQKALNDMERNVTVAKSNLRAATVLNERLGKEKAGYAKELGISEDDPNFDRTVRHKLRDVRRFETALQEHPDKTKAMQMLSDYQSMIEWQREREHAARRKRSGKDKADHG